MWYESAARRTPSSSSRISCTAAAVRSGHGFGPENRTRCVSATYLESDRELLLALSVLVFLTLSRTLSRTLAAPFSVSFICRPAVGVSGCDSWCVVGGVLPRMRLPVARGCIPYLGTGLSSGYGDRGCVGLGAAVVLAALSGAPAAGWLSSTGYLANRCCGRRG